MKFTVLNFISFNSQHIAFNVGCDRCFIFQGAQDIKFEDESAHLPGNLVVVDHVSLVVQPSVSFTPPAKYVQGNTKPVKNTKTFRKVWEMP